MGTIIDSITVEDVTFHVIIKCKLDANMEIYP